MIKRETVMGRAATVAYLKADMTPCSAEDAELVRVVFDNGDTAWLTAKPESDQPEGDDALAER